MVIKHRYDYFAVWQTILEGEFVTEEILKKYADVVIEAGINLQKDQCLLITCGVDNYDFALVAAQAAYEKGARYVDISVSGSKLTKIKSRYSNPENLSFVPNFVTGRTMEMLADDWAHLRLDNTEETDELADEDISKLESISRAERNAIKLFTKQLISFNKKWCIIAVPGRKWADKIFGNHYTEANYEKLSGAISKILRLDSPDPVQTWKEHAAKLHNRSVKLSQMKLDRVRFWGGGTDLEIGVIPGSKWKGGYSETFSNSKFIPNLPTEEVFTTPDFTRTKGMAKVTRPVKVLEKTVTGAWFEFREGKVVNFGADQNKEALEKFLEVDEGAKYLGEAALVDSSSPIFQSGIVFNSILYDENAACHIALGRGFSSVLPESEDGGSESDLKKRKCNVSLVHTDFMIGHESINVSGFDCSNKEIEIIKNGKFVI